MSPRRSGHQLRSNFSNQYACLLSLVFVLEISAAIAGFVLQGQVRGMLVRTMNESIMAYTKYETATVAVDFMQRNVGSRDFNSLFHKLT